MGQGRMTYDTPKFDVNHIRKDFPILSKKVYGHPLIYFDNAASAQKPLPVIHAMNQLIQEGYANVHRGLHFLSNHATELFESARKTTAQFLNVQQENEIIFTANATDGINLVAQSFLAPTLEAGDEIILSVMEHHSNIVPWHFLRERQGAVLKWVGMDADGLLDMDAYQSLLTPKTKMVAITQMSNALGIITPLSDIIRLAHERDIPVLVDGCQGVVHTQSDVKDIDCDFYVFSGHKIYGPTGIGVLYGKSEHLSAMSPYRGGGEMIREVTQDKVIYAHAPYKFEAGTPAIVEAIGLATALDYINNIGRDKIATYEHDLLTYTTTKMQEIPNVKLYGTTEKKGSIISFLAKDVHPHDLATVIDRSGVAIRAGHHCAQPLMQYLDLSATARLSLCMYNTKQEVDIFIEALHKTIRFFERSM